MSSVMGGVRRLACSEVRCELLGTLMSLPRSSIPLFLCQQRHASKQVRCWCFLLYRYSPLSPGDPESRRSWIVFLIFIFYIYHMVLCVCVQVKGQRKETKIQKIKVKVDKQEVEIRQRMTAAALAQAMNKDFGKEAGS